MVLPSLGLKNGFGSRETRKYILEQKHKVIEREREREEKEKELCQVTTTEWSENHPLSGKGRKEEAKETTAAAAPAPRFCPRHCPQQPVHNHLTKL